jgi:hypothetical protein
LDEGEVIFGSHGQPSGDHNCVPGP